MSFQQSPPVLIHAVFPSHDTHGRVLQSTFKQWAQYSPEIVAVHFYIFLLAFAIGLAYRSKIQLDIFTILIPDSSTSFLLLLPLCTLLLRPNLLRRALASHLRDLQSLQTVLLTLIPTLQAKALKRLQHVFDGRGLARVVGHERGAAQALAEDFVAEAEAGGVECGGEEGGLELEVRER